MKVTCKDCIETLKRIIGKLGWELYAKDLEALYMAIDVLKKLEQQKYIELPCKVGDTFYAVVGNSVIVYNCVGFKYGHSAVTRKNNELLLLTVYDMEFVFGEEAFLSNEEAEAKLKELNENE